MKVFAQTAFRYNGIDYPYGWQDVPQSLADALQVAGYVTPNDDPVKSMRLSSLEQRPTAAAFGNGDLLIVNPNYRINCTSDNVSWSSHGSSDSITDRPTAAALGKGSWQVGNGIAYSNGNSYSPAADRVYANAPSLIKWKAALAKVQTGRANASILFLGDSTESGMWASGSLYAGNRRLSVSDAVARMFVKTGIDANVGNFVGAGFPYTTSNFTDFVAYDPSFSFGAGWTWSAATYGIGAVKPSVIASAAINPMNFTPQNPDGTALVFDTIEVTTYRNATVFANFTIGVDGGAVLATSSQATTSQRYLTLSATTTLGTHTVNITKLAADTTKPFQVVFIKCYNSTKKTVFCYNGGWGGAIASQMSNDSSIYDIKGQSGIEGLQPDLTIINCAINDRGTSVINTTYKTDIQKIIDAAKLSGSVIMRTGNWISGTQNPEYVAACHELASLNNIPLVDIPYRHVSLASATAAGYMAADTVHMTDIGYQDAANAIFEAIKG